jgi:hypothetical protein
MKTAFRIVISLICGAAFIYAFAALGGEVRFGRVLYWALPLFPKTYHATGPNLDAMGYCLIVDVILVAGLIFLLLPRRRKLSQMNGK